LLIVDDGSSDGLEELILPLLAENPNWRYMKHSRRRLSATTQHRSAGRPGFYATFIDSDGRNTLRGICKRGFLLWTPIRRWI
jgi:glycosyltransferase involved in cell wall biosynthesis